MVLVLISKRTEWLKLNTNFNSLQQDLYISWSGQKVIDFFFFITTQKSQCQFGRRTLYRVYTRELDRELFYRIYPYLYTLVLGLCYDYATPTLKSMLLPHVLLLIHHKATMPYACALTLYSLISIIHVCTMCTPLLWQLLITMTNDLTNE